MDMLQFLGQTTFGDVVTASTSALTDIVPAATIALVVTAATILTLAARFGRRIIRIMN